MFLREQRQQAHLRGVGLKVDRPSGAVAVLEDYQLHAALRAELTSPLCTRPVATMHTHMAFLLSAVETALPSVPLRFKQHFANSPLPCLSLEYP